MLFVNVRDVPGAVGRTCPRTDRDEAALALNTILHLKRFPTFEIALVPFNFENLSMNLVSRIEPLGPS